ncbi:hypothetical protein EYF80_021339 [Liparis tanakae]|uniref:Uncharacterized protein n=1 Tax=Liparis tanakae TaxID=230148 RepID=A0A4Z2HRP4_9TELE|nr:hypothetical protein EYF80_021339 [Liparis tanakae]
MELMFQGARAVGSDVGTPGPIRSLESIPELVDDEKRARGQGDMFHKQDAAELKARPPMVRSSVLGTRRSELFVDLRSLAPELRVPYDGGRVRRGPGSPSDPGRANGAADSGVLARPTARGRPLKSQGQDEKQSREVKGGRLRL